MSSNKAIVQANFERWRVETGSPFELLEPHAAWTIVESSLLSNTYGTRLQFLHEVETPFNARMAKPLNPTVRAFYAHGHTVISFFDADATVKDVLKSQHVYLELSYA